MHLCILKKPETTFICRVFLCTPNLCLSPPTQKRLAFSRQMSIKDTENNREMRDGVSPLNVLVSNEQSSISAAFTLLPQGRAPHLATLALEEEQKTPLGVPLTKAKICTANESRQGQHFSQCRPPQVASCCLHR